MSSTPEIDLLQFASIYILLVVVTLIMKWANIQQTKLLIVASLRMTFQLMLAGVILTYIFKNPHPAFTVLYVLSMILFAGHRVLSPHPNLNRNFKLVIWGSLTGAGLSVMFFLVVVVTGQSITNPQFTIPLGGMLMGGALIGLSLGLKNFTEKMVSEEKRITTLLHLGVHPQKILTPIANNALEMALLPTLNSMVGTGIVWLPGMMTGQILAGASPQTAVVYQIAIGITLCTVVSLSVFCALYFGCRTLYTQNLRINWDKGIRHT